MTKKSATENKGRVGGVFDATSLLPSDMTNATLLRSAVTQQLCQHLLKAAEVGGMFGDVSGGAEMRRQMLAGLHLNTSVFKAANAIFGGPTVEPLTISPKAIKRAASTFVMALLKDNPEFKRLVCDVVIEEVQHETLMAHPASEMEQ